jgi:hypothetical protein
VKWTEEKMNEVLDAIRQYGCVVNKTVARCCH